MDRIIKGIDLSVHTVGDLFFQQARKLTFKSCGLKERESFVLRLNRRWPA